MFELPGYVVSGLIFLTMLFVFVIGPIVAGILVAFVTDVAQTKDAIGRNYPVIGDFRYLFTMERYGAGNAGLISDLVPGQA